MNAIATQTLNGLAIGVMLFFIASGLSVVFGLMRVMNMAHGAMYLLGGFVAVTVQTSTKNFLLAAVAGLVAAAVLGWVVQALFLRTLMHSEFRQVMLTLGVAFVVSDAILWVFGGMPRSIRPPSFLSTSMTIGSFVYPTYRVGLIILGLLAAVAIYLMWTKSSWGAVLRACVDDQTVAATQGINVGRVFSVVFVIAAMLAGLASVLAGPVLGVYIGLDFEMLLLAIVVVIIGGMGSLEGAFVGALLVGLIDSFSKAYVPDLSYFTVFAPVILVLLLRPQGLFGRGGN
ncbi:MAG: branched-chain amino acid ABC transporter permease [Actinobacteria bacterium]|nr:branched-chain amino acid ABC transporter permease [Actinomycetota bacterium]